MYKKLLFTALVAGMATHTLAGNEKNYDVKWTNDHSCITVSNPQCIRINYDSVCYNYESGSADFRGCQLEAQKKFKELCKHFASKKPGSSPHEMFCHAAENYHPIEG